MPSIKQKRIASEMMRVISSILLEEARDNLLKTITITGCDVANDLSYAKVYFTSLSEMSHKDLEHEMEEASPYIRTLVAEKMDLRNTPKLRFIYDESIAYGDKIEHILKEINNE
jgi:ribosome-binding factor A